MTRAKFEDGSEAIQDNHLAAGDSQLCRGVNRSLVQGLFPRPTGESFVSAGSGLAAFLNC